MAAPLAQSRERVEVLVAGQLLQKSLEAGILLLAAPGGAVRPLDSAEVSFRFNNWDRVRAHDYATGMLLSAVMSWGAALAAFGLWQESFARRRERSPGTAGPQAPH